MVKLSKTDWSLHTQHVIMTRDSPFAIFLANYDFAWKSDTFWFSVFFCLRAAIDSIHKHFYNHFNGRFLIKHWLWNKNTHFKLFECLPFISTLAVSAGIARTLIVKGQNRRSLSVCLVAWAGWKVQSVEPYPQSEHIEERCLFWKKKTLFIRKLWSHHEGFRQTSLRTLDRKPIKMLPRKYDPILSKSVHSSYLFVFLYSDHEAWLITFWMISHVIP